MSVMRKSLLEAFTSNPVSDRMDFDQTRFLVCSCDSSSNLWKKDFVFLCHRFPFLNQNLKLIFNLRIYLKYLIEGLVSKGKARSQVNRKQSGKPRVSSDGFIIPSAFDIRLSIMILVKKVHWKSSDSNNTSLKLRSTSRVYCSLIRRDGVGVPCTFISTISRPVSNMTNSTVCFTERTLMLYQSLGWDKGSALKVSYWTG